MNWLTNFVRPKIRALIGNDVPDNLWDKCSKCGQMIFQKELKANFRVCPHCNNHMYLSVDERIEMLFDKGTFVEITNKRIVLDPLKFKDTKKYVDRLKQYKEKTKHNDSVVAGYGQIGGNKIVVLFFDFEFMGGSMGTYVGELFITAVDYAVKKGCAFMVVPCSGGARMQEGIFSLMQMPRTTVAVNKLNEAGLPYIVLLTNPTTGGVSASFAMLGDIHIAEPEAVIAFTGPRVIESTIREKLPDGFQRSEYLLKHGMVDMVVARKELKATLSNILSLLEQKR